MSRILFIFQLHEIGYTKGGESFNLNRNDFSRGTTYELETAFIS